MQLQGTTEDNTVRTMFVATGVMSFALLVPKTAISHTFAHSLLLTPALSKLCVDGLRITFEVRLLVFGPMFLERFKAFLTQVRFVFCCFASRPCL